MTKIRKIKVAYLLNNNKIDSERAKEEFLALLPPDPEPKYILERFWGVKEKRGNR